MKKLFKLFICLLLVFVVVGCDKEGKTDIGTALPEDIAAINKKYYDVKKDDLKWDYNSTTKTIIISGKGPMKSYLDDAPEWDYLNSEALKVVIGDEVTSVSGGAFLYFTALQEVKFGDAIEFIGDSSFNGDTNLRTINFPSNLKYIGSYAFNNTILHSNNGFNLPEGLLYVGDSSFRSAFKESYVSIPSSLNTIESTAFNNIYVEEFRVDENNKSFKALDGVIYDKNITVLYNYPSLKNTKIFEIPNTVEIINEEAITTTNDMTKLIIPKSVKTINEGAIFWNYGLNTIEVDKDNKDFESIDGVLYSKDGKRLISYPVNKETDNYYVKDTVEVIEKYALSGANNLKEIYIYEGLKSLNEGSIYLCNNLEKLTLPKSLEKIEEYALENNYNLKQINYLSDKKDWNKIDIKDNNNTLKSTDLKINYIVREN